MKKILLVLIVIFMLGGKVDLKTNYNPFTVFDFFDVLVEKIVLKPIEEVNTPKYESQKLGNEFADSGLPEWVTKQP